MISHIYINNIEITFIDASFQPFPSNPQFHHLRFPTHWTHQPVLGRESLTFTHQNTALVSTTCHLVVFWVHQKKHQGAEINGKSMENHHLLHCFCLGVVFAFFWGPENIGCLFYMSYTSPLSLSLDDSNLWESSRGPILYHEDFIGREYVQNCKANFEASLVGEDGGSFSLGGMLNCTTVDGWNPANQLICSISHYLQGSKYIPRSAGILPSTVSFIHLQITAAYQFFLGSWNHCCEKRKTGSVDVDSLGVFGTNSKSNLS